ncbi:MAG: hypothetical protein II838_12190 [Lachnospiraceae bacterium]|nr:hypothetical protein [Lachnospiraceae bacterium]
MMINGASSVSSSTTDVYKEYVATADDKKVNDEKKETTNDQAAVYEKSEDKQEKGLYSINKMTKEERSAMVQKLKEDQQMRQQQLLKLAQEMLTKQGGNFMIANVKIDTLSEEDDSIWKFLASGEYTVDEAAKAKAQELVSEDGYYGVKQTSERLFDFASALAGDDVEQMKKMQDAVLKGYKEAEKAWGRDLPEISKKTLEATNKLFEDYYASKNATTVE